MVRTPPFQGENPGSNPSGAAKIKRPPDENRRFDTIVGKNKRNTLRDVRALRVVSNANNPSGAAKIKNAPYGAFCFGLLKLYQSFLAHQFGDVCAAHMFKARRTQHFHKPRHFDISQFLFIVQVIHAAHQDAYVKA